MASVMPYGQREGLDTELPTAGISYNFPSHIQSAAGAFAYHFLGC